MFGLFVGAYSPLGLVQAQLSYDPASAYAAGLASRGLAAPSFHPYRRDDR